MWNALITFAKSVCNVFHRITSLERSQCKSEKGSQKQRKPKGKSLWQLCFINRVKSDFHRLLKRVEIWELHPLPLYIYCTHDWHSSTPGIAIIQCFLPNGKLGVVTCGEQIFSVFFCPLIVIQRVHIVVVCCKRHALAKEGVCGKPNTINGCN